MKISVTQKHIEDAESFRRTPNVRRSRSCAVVLALIDAGFSQATVGMTYIRLNGDGDSKKIEMSATVGRFVVDADNRLPVEPFEFDLEVPA